MCANTKLMEKNKPCQVLIVPTSLLFVYALRLLISESLGWQALYRAALTNHRTIEGTLLPQCFYPEDEIIKMKFSEFDSQMRESVYNGVLYS